MNIERRWTFIDKAPTFRPSMTRVQNFLADGAIRCEVLHINAGVLRPSCLVRTASLPS
jgi:hypothetical protein